MNFRLFFTALITLLFVVLGSAQPIPGRQQTTGPFEFSACSGMTISKWVTSIERYRQYFGYLPGAFIGLGVSYQQTGPFGLETGLEFSGKGASSQSGASFIRLNYLTVPAALRFSLANGLIKASAGLYFSLLVSQDKTSRDYSSRKVEKKTDNGFAGKLQFNILKHKNYQAGISTAYEAGFKEIYFFEITPHGATDIIRYKNRSFHLGLYFSGKIN